MDSAIVGAANSSNLLLLFIYEFLCFVRSLIGGIELSLGFLECCAGPLQRFSVKARCCLKSFRTGEWRVAYEGKNVNQQRTHSASSCWCLKRSSFIVSDRKSVV